MKHLLALMLIWPLTVWAEPTLPPDAPAIASDYHSRIGVNGLPRRSVHQGIDIAGPEGMVVIAAGPGRVLEATVERCWGPTVVIDHGPGANGKTLIALYGHVGEMLVRPGQTVRRGQPIAKLGNNHRQFDCISGVRHLHFQLGRKHRAGDKGSYWGHLYFLHDGDRGLDPHRYWADGPRKVTCFLPGRRYPVGSLTYPVRCQ